jgi:hypothetical protein
MVRPRAKKLTRFRLRIRILTYKISVCVEDYNSEPESHRDMVPDLQKGCGSVQLELFKIKQCCFTLSRFHDKFSIYIFSTSCGLSQLVICHQYTLLIILIILIEPR